MRYLLSIILTLSVFLSHAQFTDDFSDGDFATNPTWNGENEKFEVNSLQTLHLYDATESGSAFLRTVSSAINDASWEFLVKFDFNPSSANYADVYLVSDQADLSGGLNGYFVKVGNTSDEVSLYRQDGNSKTEIIDGADGRVNSNTVNVRIHVNRDQNGNWSLQTDTLGGFDYVTEGSVTDNTHSISHYFGLHCIFSSTRWDKMYFDDFSVSGNPFMDEVSPELTGFEILNNMDILLNFSEPMDENTSLNTANYQMNNGMGNPTAASFNEGNPSQVLLTFAPGLQENISYELMYQNMTDLSGNVIEAGSIDILIMNIAENDVVFSEIMADPTPAVNLPEKEYLEIYNRKNFPVNLNGWKLVIGNNAYAFPSVNIEANGYLIICDEDDAPEFTTYGETAPFSGFPAYIFSNSGTTLKLLDADSILVSQVSYTEEWYQDPDKDDGGWSIERIDPENHCSGMSNWAASISVNGGTPGEINSVDGDNVDNTAPAITSWEISSANEITLFFNEVPDTLTALNLGNYNLSPDFGSPLYIYQNPENSVAFHLQFIAGFSENVQYTLSIRNIADVCENIMDDTELQFINYIAKSFDVLITEIMADPAPPVYLPEAEYLELHNRTPFNINLSGWVLQTGNSELILPATEIPGGGYFALTDAENIEGFSGYDNILAIDDMPSLTNSSGELCLISPQGIPVHFVNYSETWYSSPVKQEGGWSLEMIDLNNPCGGALNWAESIHESGGTPGSANSVMNENPDNIIPEIHNVIIHGQDSLYVYFNEDLHPGFIPTPSNFSVNNGVGEALSASKAPGFHNTFILGFETSFETETIYELRITDTITDCAGNQLSGTLYHNFAVADSVETQDIVINEILFNPIDGGSDYIELYNRSDKFINLSDLRIATRDDSLLIDDMEIITELGFLVFPGEYVVISEDISSVERDYYCKNPQHLLKVNNLPSYGNESGEVVLCTRNLSVIDEVYYHEDMHFQLLKSFDGVALERIDYNNPGQEPGNWHSAAESAGFGTPTYENSQYMTQQGTSSRFDLMPESISPDNDGFEDFLSINYSMDQPGYVLSVSIYNASGHFIRQVTENELLGTEGILRWDGLDENGQHPGAGVYIVLLDYFDLKGNRHQEKHSCIVAVMR